MQATNNLKISSSYIKQTGETKSNNTLYLNVAGMLSF